MRNRERGASQIPLVICIVLLLIAGFVAYSQYGEAQTLEARLTAILNSAKGKDDANPPGDATVREMLERVKGPLANAKARLEEVVVETGGTDEVEPELVVSPEKLRNTRNKFLEAADKGEFVIEMPVSVHKENAAGGAPQPAAGGKVNLQYFQNKDLRGAAPDLTNILEYVVIPGARRMVSDIKHYQQLYEQALAAKETAEAAYRADLQKKDDEIRAKVEENAALEARKNQDITDLRNQVQDAEAAKAAAEAEKTKSVDDLTKERNQLRAELEKASAQVQVLKSRKRAVETDTSPDGTVLTVSDAQDFVVIDLGKANNNLLAGTNFDVYAIGKGGMEIPKGMIKVTRVDGEESNCAVVEVFDRFNPISPGDKIRSMTYDPKESVHVALVGRFQRMGKSDMATRLRSLGVIVDDKVTINTTFLVVGAPENDAQPIEETAEYKAAELYGIQRTTERELGRFTQY
jgi:hypothetical protein